MARKDILIREYKYSVNSFHLTRGLYQVSGTAGNLVKYYVRSGHYYISDNGYTVEPHYMDLSSALRICFA